MKINRIEVKEAFDNYVENYDSSDEKIKLKIEHTYRVSELCERIAKSINMSNEDIEIAWIIGMLHDVGRFEQVKRYETFNDFKSVDHAKLGVEILFKDGKIREFIDDLSKYDLIKNVIENHNAYKIAEDISEESKTFCNILRDADKIDILKVNTIVPLEEIYNVTTDEIYNSEVTKEVLENFKRKDTILRTLKRTAVDNIVGHISLLFGLVYDESIKIVKEQQYLKQILEFKSKNEYTNEQFEEIREITNRYMDERVCNMTL
ncbi:HD domain-containing protein [Clostridium sp. D53t1_180928_C8]|uniref:HD domain-containing protein n=1 Tax=Clostridium sp. D53t1_180928_C8 TaxID=2787101 RepID=UPI0018AB4ECD|nr:HD domain-containing protein [Clostridium sp. D53t1_180928_C8]